MRNIDALASRRSVWVPDLPGYGESDEPGPGGLPSLLDATIATLHELVGTGTEIGLVGFSFSGLVAVHVAAQRQYVRRLALLGPGGHGGRRRPRDELQRWRAAVDATALADVIRHNPAAHMLHDSTGKWSAH